MLAASADKDPQEVAELVRSYAQGRRLLVPLLYVGQTIDAVVRGVLLLVSNWRLLLLELVPALWMGAITWDWRSRTFGRLPLPDVYGLQAVVVATIVIATTFIAYWCNSVFAFTAVQPPPVDVKGAYASARLHTGRITRWALAVGTAHALVAVFITRTNVALYSIALGAVAMLQMYGLVALPVALVVRPAKEVLTRRERVARMALKGALSGVASTPGFLLNRLAILLFALGAPWAGVALLIPAVIFQAAGAASARAVQLATRVKEASASETQGQSASDTPAAPERPPEA